MEELSLVLEQYSPIEIVLLILFILIGTKTISTIFEWFYNKFHDYFSKKNKEEEQIDNLQNEHKDIYKQLDNIENILSIIQGDVKTLTERMQENTKTYIIDKYHYFCDSIKAIDDASLQSLELRYMYYKSAGGNSYIDNLMNEIRELPKVSIKQIAELRGVSNDPRA